MAAPLILARTFKDAHAYAKDVLGLRFGNYRVVNSVGTLKATRGADLHLVPGWDKRPDRFTMKGALRYTRHNIIDVAEQQAAEPVEPRGIPLTDPATGTTSGVPSGIGDLTSNTLETVNDIVGEFFDGITPETVEPTATCVDCGLDPHDPECISVESPTVDHQQGELNLPEEPAEAPKKRRRRKCADCEQLHYKGDPCIDSEAV